MALIWDSWHIYLNLQPKPYTFFFYLEVVANARSCLHSHQHNMPWRTLSCQASQEFTHTGFIWRNLRFVGEDIPYDECDPTEECFSVCVVLYRGGSMALWKYTLYTTVSSSDHISIPDIFAVILIAPSRYFLLLLCLLSHLSLDVWRVHSWFWFGTFIYIAQCLQPVTRVLCTGRLHFSHPSFDHKKRNSYKHLYFPHALNTDTGIIEARKLSSNVYFPKPCFQQPSCT